VGILKWEVDLSKLTFIEVKLPLCFS